MLNIKTTNKSVLVGDVVRQFELVEGHGPTHPLFAGQRRVGVDVVPGRHLWVRLAGDDPARVVKLVAAVVDGHDVHQQYVAAAFVEALDLDLERREHPPKVGAYMWHIRRRSDDDHGPIEALVAENS